MLGLADRSKLILLFKKILLGDQKNAISNLRELIDSGLDAKNFLNDILEILYLFSRRINLGPIEKDMMISESEVQLIDEYSKNLDMYDLGIFWQLTIKTIDDLKIVTNENLTLEMFVMQLIHLKNIEHVSEKKIEIQDNDKILSNHVNQKNKPETKPSEKALIGSVKSQMKSVDQIKENIIKNPEIKKNINLESQIKCYEDIIILASKEKEVELKYDLERNVKLVSFNRGKIDISFNERLNKNFIKILSEKLLVWTGERWIISLSKTEGKKTIYDKNLEAKSANLIKEENSELARKLLLTFPDAKLIDVKEDEND